MPTLSNMVHLEDGLTTLSDLLIRNETLNTFINAEKEVCYKYGIKFLDLYHDYATYALLADGVHFNLEGERLNGRVIGNTLNNI